MGTLNEFLVEKRVAFRARQVAAAAEPKASQFVAKGRVVGRTGIREIRIRDFQIVTDTPPGFAGYDLGPNAPELMLGAFASCLMHTALTLAADQELSLDAVDVEVSCHLHPLGQTPGFMDTPVEPHNVAYKLHIDSTESAERIAALHVDIEKRCTLVNLLKNSQTIAGEAIHTTLGATAAH